MILPIRSTDRYFDDRCRSHSVRPAVLPIPVEQHRRSSQDSGVQAVLRVPAGWEAPPIELGVETRGVERVICSPSLTRFFSAETRQRWQCIFVQNYRRFNRFTTMRVPNLFWVRNVYSCLPHDLLLIPAFLLSRGVSKVLSVFRFSLSSSMCFDRCRMTD